MSNWEHRLNLQINCITLFGKDCYWKKAIFYRDIRQTSSAQTDMNPEGTDKIRKISEKILKIPNVRKVKFWRNTVFITISDGLTAQQANGVVSSAIEVLARFNLYG